MTRTIYRLIRRRGKWDGELPWDKAGKAINAFPCSVTYDNRDITQRAQGGNFQKVLDAHFHGSQWRVERIIQETRDTVRNYGVRERYDTGAAGVEVEGSHDCI